MTEEKTADIGELVKSARNQLALIHSLANDITEANWDDKRLYVLQTCVRQGDDLAALEARCAELEARYEHSANHVAELEMERDQILARDRIEREPVVKALTVAQKALYNTCLGYHDKGKNYGDDPNYDMASDALDVVNAALASAPERVDVNASLPERIWLGAGNDDNEHAVWFDPDEGGTLYVRVDLASPPAPVVTDDADLREALRGIKMIHDGLADPTRPRQAVGEVAAFWMAKVEAALASREAT